MTSIIAGVIVVIALVTVPLTDRKRGRRVAFAIFFLLVGEAMVLWPDSLDSLRAGLMLLMAAVLLLAELAAVGSAGGRLLVGLLWLGGATVSIWQWSTLGEWVDAHRAWVLIGAVAGAILCGLIASGRRRIVVDRYTMRGM